MDKKANNQRHEAVKLFRTLLKKSNGLESEGFFYRSITEFQRDNKGAWTMKVEKFVDSKALEFSHQSSRSSFKNDLQIELSSKPELKDFFKEAESSVKGSSESSKPKFVEITNLNEVFGDATDAKVAFEKGKILFIDIWATWCGPCQGPMQHNQDMKTKNRALWGDKVRIACISLDDNKDDVIERINTKKWKSLEHYQVEGGWDKNHNLFKKYQVKGIPKGILVNSSGDIVYEGHPASVDLEGEINKLIQEMNSSNPTSLTKEGYKKVKDFFEKERNTPEIIKDQDFSLSIKFVRAIWYEAKSDSAGKVVYQKPALAINCNSKNQAVARTTYQDIVKKLDAKDLIEFNENQEKGSCSIF